MSVQVGLNLVTLVMCIITLAMATAALMPQIKAGLVLLRDLALWGILVGVLVMVGFVGWVRLIEVRRERQQTAETTEGQFPADDSLLGSPSIRRQLESLRDGRDPAPRRGAPKDLLETYRFPDRNQNPAQDSTPNPVFRANRSSVRRPAFRAAAPR